MMRASLSGVSFSLTFYLSMEHFGLERAVCGFSTWVSGGGLETEQEGAEAGRRRSRPLLNSCWSCREGYS